MKFERILLTMMLLFTVNAALADIVDDAFQGANDMTSRALALAKVIGQITTTQMPKAQRDPLIDKIRLTFIRLYQAYSGDVQQSGQADDMAIGQALETYSTNAVGYGAAMVKLVTGRLHDLDTLQDPQARGLQIGYFLTKLVDRLKLMFDTDDAVRAQFDAVKVDGVITTDILNGYAQVAQAIILSIPKDTIIMVSGFKINAMIAEIIKRTGLVVGSNPCEANGDKDNSAKQTQAAQTAETKISALFNQKNAAKPQDYADVVTQIIMSLKSDFLYNRSLHQMTVTGPQQAAPIKSLNSALKPSMNTPQQTGPQTTVTVKNESYKVGDNPYEPYFEMIATDKILLGWITPPAVPDKVVPADIWQIDIVRIPGDLDVDGRFWVNQNTVVKCNPPAIQTPDKTGCMCPKDGSYVLSSGVVTGISTAGATLQNYTCTRSAAVGDDAADGFFVTGPLTQSKCVGKASRTPDKKGCRCDRPPYDWYTPKIVAVGSDKVDIGPLKIVRTQYDCVAIGVDDFLEAQEKNYCVNQNLGVCVQGRLFEGITEALKVAKWSAWTEQQKQRALTVVKQTIEKLIDQPLAAQLATMVQFVNYDERKISQFYSGAIQKLMDILIPLSVVLAQKDQDATTALLEAPKLQLVDMARKMLKSAATYEPAKIIMGQLLEGYSEHINSQQFKLTEASLGITHDAVVSQFAAISNAFKKLAGQ